MDKIKHIHCPVGDMTCPYFAHEGHPCRCTLEDPLCHFDDFGFFWDEGDDYIEDDWEG